MTAGGWEIQPSHATMQTSVQSPPLRTTATRPILPPERRHGLRLASAHQVDVHATGAPSPDRDKSQISGADDDPRGIAMAG
jgi:hypothetical protein